MRGCPEDEARGTCDCAPTCGETGSMGLMGVRGESGGSDARRVPGDEGPMEVAMNAGEGGRCVDASDSRRAFRRMPPRGAVSGEENDGLGGMSSEGPVGEMPSEVMCRRGSEIVKPLLSSFVLAAATSYRCCAVRNQNIVSLALDLSLHRLCCLSLRR